MCSDTSIADINDFAKCYLSDAKIDVRDSKVIHECIWGTHPYKNYEILKNYLSQKDSIIPFNGDHSFHISEYERFNDVLLSFCSTITKR